MSQALLRFDCISIDNNVLVIFKVLEAPEEQLTLALGKVLSFDQLNATIIAFTRSSTGSFLETNPTVEMIIPRKDIIFSPAALNKNGSLKKNILKKVPQSNLHFSAN